MLGYFPSPSHLSGVAMTVPAGQFGAVNAMPGNLVLGYSGFIVVPPITWDVLNRRVRYVSRYPWYGRGLLRARS